MRMVISMSSPSVCRENPPSATSRSRRKTPNAPLMINTPFISDHATRVAKNPRRYSSTWVAPTPRHDIAGATTRPPTILDPFATRMPPPAAMQVSGWISNGRTERVIASGSSRLSASMITTSSPRATEIPALIASERPPFSLPTTRSLGSTLEMLTLRIGAVSSTVLPRSGSGTRSNASSSRANVSSREPSSTTITSSGA
jgi:hypothetical protein